MASTKQHIQTIQGQLNFKKSSNSTQCTIIVKVYIDKNKHQYSIYYNNIFSGTNSNKINNAHPFYNTKYEEHLSGDIIFMNTYTTKLIEFLVNDYSNIFNDDKIISNTIYTKTFRFYSDFYDEHDTEFVDTIITIKTIKYKENNYYLIKYNHSKPSTHISHPFYKSDHEDSCQKHIILKNPLTDKLVEYLNMDFEVLSEYTGLSTPQCYKKKLMNFTASLNKVITLNKYKKLIMKHICQIYD